MIFSKEFSYLGKPKWTTLNFREVFLRKKTKDRMWSMLFHLFLTTGLAAADCDIDACNIAISSSVGAARVCSTFGGLYYNRYWASFYTGCETATAVAQVGQLACGLCGDGDGISAEELRGLIGKVLEAENETQGLVGQVLNTQHETQSLIRRNAQEIMDGFKEVNQNIKKVGNQINSLRNDVSQLIKIKALQTSYLDDLHNFDLMAQKFEDLGSESFGLIVKSGKVDDFKTVVNDISEGAERTYANLHDMLIGGNWFHDSIFEIDSTSCSSKDYFLSLMTRLIEFEATAKAMDRKALDPVKIDRFKKMFIEIEQKHIETCGCPDGQAVRMRNLQRLVSHPTPRTSIAEFYNTISSSDLVDRLTQKKLNLLYKAKPFDFNLSILRAIKTLPIEVPEKISSLAEHNALSTLPLLENKLICTKSKVAATIVLSSTARAAEHQGSRLGEFVEAGEHGGKQFFRQQDTEGQRETFLYSEGGKWWVSDILGQSNGFLRNFQNTNKPPSTQWEYYNGEKWNDDDTSFTLEFTTLSPICQLVRVAGEGGVVRNQRTSLGDYRSECISVLINMQRVNYRHPKIFK